MRETRKDVLAEIRETVKIDCYKVYSEPRKTHQRHKFYMCENANQTVTAIKRAIKKLEYKYITVRKVNYVAPRNSYSMNSTNVVIEFPFHTYC